MLTTYLEFYDLMKPPFDVRAGRGPVLATRGLRDALAWLTERIEADDPVLCVSGAPGVGRSSLARVLPGALAATCRVARIPNALEAWEDVRKRVARQLLVDAGLSTAGLVDARAMGQRLVLLVDAAERADAEFLDHLDLLLDRRGPARERLVQAVLLARSGPVPAPAEPPIWAWLEARQGISRELDPLSPEEIHRYIRKRLESAGRRRSSELFTETASLVIHRHTRGVPRRVNQACDQVLREALRRSIRQVDAQLASEAIGGWVTVGVAPATAPALRAPGTPGRSGSRTPSGLG